MRLRNRMRLETAWAGCGLLYYSRLFDDKQLLAVLLSRSTAASDTPLSGPSDRPWIHAKAR